MKTTKGKTTQVIGPVIDVIFDEKEVPPLYSALFLTLPDKTKLTLEVAQHLGGGEVRSVSLGPTEGVKRGQEVETEGKPVSVPVGKGTLGRIFNVTGDAIDGKGVPKNVKEYPIHREAPKITDQEVKQEVLETGIKVIDLIAPFQMLRLADIQQQKVYDQEELTLRFQLVQT